MARPQFILTTRPAEDAFKDINFLESKNLQCISAPMLKIVKLNARLPEPDGFEAIVLTSRHAAPLITNTGFHHLPCFCVGTSTAAAAKTAGFTHIITGKGDGASLAKTICEHKHKQIFWASAKDTGFNIKTAVAVAEIAVMRVAVYEAAFIDDFSPAALEAIGGGNVRIVMAHSGRAGARFTHLMQRHRLEHLLKEMVMIAISMRAAGLCGKDWHTIKVAEAPTGSAMLNTAITAMNALN